MHRNVTSKSHSISKQGGLTLIELMVGLVIGLVLAIIASSTYLYSKQAYNAVSETSQLEENGRFALALLSRNIQTAGYVAIDPSDTATQGASDIKVKGCDFGMTNPQGATSLTDLACLSSTPAGSSRSASIGVFYNTDAFGTASTSFQGFDCLGNAPVTVASPTTGSPTYQVRNYFYVSTSSVQTPNGTTTMGQLSCVTDPTTVSGATGTFQAQPLIPGVHQIGLNYLTASAVDPNTAQTRNTATVIETSSLWPKVIAVELCVLTKSIQASGNDTATQMTDCFGNAFTPPASQSFRRFTTIVNMRNRTS
jgi:type IV pilus assembly protein PilW